MGSEVYDKMTADELKAAQEAGRTGGTIDDSFLQQAGEMGSQLAGEIIPGFRDLDPVTGAVTSKFNFGKALQTVSVAGTLGSLNMLAEELKKQKQLDEQKQREYGVSGSSLMKEPQAEPMIKVVMPILYY